MSNRTALDGTFMPYPAQPPVTVGDNAPEFVPPVNSIYNGSNPYPSTRAEIAADYNQMGYHLVAVRLHPIEFEPESKKIYINSFGFTLRYQQGGQQVKRPQAQSERRTRLIKQMIASMVENPQDIERFSSTYQKQTTPMAKAASNAVRLPSLEKILSEQIPDYIIITNEELRPEFSRLANWKIQKGVPTMNKGHRGNKGRIHRQRPAGENPYIFARMPRQMGRRLVCVAGRRYGNHTVKILQRNRWSVLPF